MTEAPFCAFKSSWAEGRVHSPTKGAKGTDARRILPTDRRGDEHLTHNPDSSPNSPRTPKMPPAATSCSLPASPAAPSKAGGGPERLVGCRQRPELRRAGGLQDGHRVSRKGFVAGLVGAALMLTSEEPSRALGFKKELKKRKIDPSEYSQSSYDGLMIYDTVLGQGPAIEKGQTVVVHFDCRYLGLDVVSSRLARTLGGNRVVAEPFEFVAGGTVEARNVTAGTQAGGLFVGGSGPKPPPALSTAVLGMREGGK
eukprot:evm.model.scf_805.5 EVM.evm.TU.scf_805.5   scf_805:49282-53426(+)